MRNFMSKTTANPMHNVLKEAIEAAGLSAQPALIVNWQAFSLKFRETCNAYIETRPEQGLYTTGAYSLIHACNHMRHLVESINEMQAFGKLSEIAMEKLEGYQNTDTLVGLYWSHFAEDYAIYMPHCNNRIMEDFKEIVSKCANQEYIHNPDADIRITAASAVRQAAKEMMVRHPDATHIQADMQHVEMIARDHRAMLLDALVVPYQPKDIVQSEPQISPTEMFVENTQPSHFMAELQRGLLTMTLSERDALDEHWADIVSRYVAYHRDHVTQNEQDMYPLGPYRIACDALVHALTDEVACTQGEDEYQYSPEYVQALTKLTAWAQHNETRCDNIDAWMKESFVSQAVALSENHTASSAEAFQFGELVAEKTMLAMQREPNRAYVVHFLNELAQAAGENSHFSDAVARAEKLKNELSPFEEHGDYASELDEEDLEEYL